MLCTQFATAAKASGKRVFTPGNVDACINKTKSVYAKTSPITPQDMADMLDALQLRVPGRRQDAGRRVRRQVRLRGQGDLRQGPLRHDDDQGRRRSRAAIRAPCARPATTARRIRRAVLVCMAKAATGATCSATVAVPRGAALLGRHVHRPRRRGRRLHEQRRLRDRGALLRSRTPATAATPGLSFAALSPSCADYGGTHGCRRQRRRRRRQRRRRGRQRRRRQPAAAVAPAAARPAAVARAAARPAAAARRRAARHGRRGRLAARLAAPRARRLRAPDVVPISP